MKKENPTMQSENAIEVQSAAVEGYGDREMAATLSVQWRRAQAGLVEILRFGAMLLEARDRIEATVVSSREHGADGRITGRDPGLKGWLSEHCPEIHYKTAYGYMAAAAGLRIEARLAADVPLLALMGADPVPEARAEKLRQRVLKAIEGSTLTLLREAARAPEALSAPRGGARDGAGRPPQADDAATHAAAEWGWIGRRIDRCMQWHFARHMPEAVAREALDTLALLRDALKARLAELAETPMK